MKYLSAKDKGYMNEQARVESSIKEDLKENTEEQFDHDMDNMRQQRIEEGSMFPDDQYKIRLWRMSPTAEKHFDKIIDKDLVLANLRGTKPDLEQVSITIQTLELLRRILIVKTQFGKLDNEGQPIRDKDGHVILFETVEFDNYFDPVFYGMLSYVKGFLVGSRATGDKPENILDKMQILTKGLEKKQEKKDKTIGFGG